MGSMSAANEAIAEKVARMVAVETVPAGCELLDWSVEGFGTAIGVMFRRPDGQRDAKMVSLNATMDPQTGIWAFPG